MFDCTLAESSKSEPIRERFFPLADLRTGRYVSFRIFLRRFQLFAGEGRVVRITINRDESVISSDVYRARISDARYKSMYRCSPFLLSARFRRARKSQRDLIRESERAITITDQRPLNLFLIINKIARRWISPLDLAEQIYLGRLIVARRVSLGRAGLPVRSRSFLLSDENFNGKITTE